MAPFHACEQSGQYPAHRGADAATAAVGCNATSKKQGLQGHPQITAVPGLHEDFPRALKAPGDMHSLRDQLRSDACTPEALQHTRIISAPAATAVRRR